jgi:hypothetical protein
MGLRSLLGGLLGGFLGVAAWVFIGYSAGYDVVWVAWGIGFMVGFGVRYGAHLGHRDESGTQAVVAAAIAVGAIVCAKILLYTVLVHNYNTEVFPNAMEHLRQKEAEVMIACVADGIVEDMIDNSQTVPWPDGMTWEEARRERDYPPAIWEQAKSRWDKMGEHDRKQLVPQRGKQPGFLVVNIAVKPEFGDFFSLWDTLWFVLAAGTAFRIGNGTYGTD